MKKRALIFSIYLLYSSLLFAQVAINTDGSDPANSAMLEVKSTNKGFLPPRMTKSQILAITSPDDGLMVYCITDSRLYIYVSSLGYWNEVTFGGILCGFSFTVSHTAGPVAPVNKTVTYGTVTNIPGEPTKCWITSNLGANHQATAVDDDTEASAGWYWQFNRQQGYKHNGVFRLPLTTWIASIDENSNWITANDPCYLLLGTGWRLPTSTEWTNVNASGGWTNWSGPWNSELKIHAAGYLLDSNGSLDDRGTYGEYWSSTQYDNFSGRHLGFNSSYCNIYSSNKSFGYSARCLLD